METAIGVLPQVVLNCSEKNCFTEIIPLLTVSMGQLVNVLSVYTGLKRIQDLNGFQVQPGPSRITAAQIILVHYGQLE